MIIETQRLRLRPYYDHEVDTLSTLANHWDIAKWMVALPYPYQREDAVRWIAHVQDQHARGKPVSFAFAVKDSDQLIGGGGLDGAFAHTQDRIALGYWLGLPYHGQGYATEIARALIAYGFHDLEADAIFATANPGNAASQNVLVKAGMESLGTLDLSQPTREGGYMYTHAYHITRTMYHDDDR